MRVLIIEDEPPAARQLEKLLREIRPDLELSGHADSVESAVRQLQQQPKPDLIFMDIQLADGLSFEIFPKVEVTAPVVFTTAYDHYTLRAFKVNSIDYLLKPVEPEELKSAMRKFEQVYQRQPAFDAALIDQLLRSMSRPAFKERFLVKTGQALTFLPVEEIRYICSEEGLVYARTISAKKHHLDYTLDELEEVLDPSRFFRINRKLLVHIDSIRKISPYFNSRLIVELAPPADTDAIVSRDRVNSFKQWLDK